MKKIKTFNVVLCGPGDVAKEIGIAREVIAEWNQRNWEGLNCGLKDKHWDSDAVPSMQARGQQVINWELIDNADILVAIFWQRLGTPTGMNESGTAEEVRRAEARGIEVMLYFSDVEDIRADHDPDQRDMLRAFRAKAMQCGLPWAFQSRAEFRKRFGDHLSKKVHEILARKQKSKTKKKPSIQQTATGTANVQLAGDGNTVNVKTASTRSPKIVIAPSPGHLNPSEQRLVADWIEELAVLMETVEGKTTKRAKGELWSRLKNQLDVQKYEQIESASLSEVMGWVSVVRKELERKAQRKAPAVFVAARIPAIKARMTDMSRTNSDYYPEIATRLKIRRFTTLKDLSPKNLERVYQLVLRDSKQR
jgi:hypothetical protein